MVATARALGKAVWFSIDDVPSPVTGRLDTPRRTS
jgi:hypothetical protein